MSQHVFLQNMNLQFTGLNKTLVALVTFVWLDITVNENMSSQFTRFKKRFVALVTFVWPLFAVSQNVFL